MVRSRRVETTMKSKYHICVWVIVATIVAGGFVYLVQKNTTPPVSSEQTENPIYGHVKTYAPTHFGL